MPSGGSGFIEQLESNPFFKNGGVFVTIAINVILLVIVMSIYVCCIRYCTIFNVRKKKRLIAKCLKREDELFVKQQSHTRDSENNHNNQEDEIREESNSEREHHESNKGKSLSKTVDQHVEDDSSFFEVKDLRAKYLSNHCLSDWYLRSVFFWRITKSLIQAPFLIIYRALFNGRNKSWFGAAIKEEKRVIRNYGRDILTYIKFHQLLWWVFAIMLVLFSALLYPIHITNQGNLDPAQKEKFSKNVTGLKVGSSDQFLVVSSINTVIGRPDILILHVILSVITVALVLAMLLLFTRDKSLRDYDYCGCDQEGIYGSFSPYLPHYFGAEFALKTQNMSLGTPHENLNYKSLSPFTLEIHNIPKHYTNKALFHQLMKKIFSHNATDLNAPTNPHILSSYHVINFAKREKLQQKFETQLDKLEGYNWQLETKNTRPKKKCFFQKQDDGDSKRKLIQSKDAIVFTKEKIRNLNTEIEDLEEELTLSSNYPNRISSSIQGSGIGYVVFSSRSSLVYALKKFTKLGTFKVYKMKETDDNGQEIEKLFTPAERNQLPIDAKVTCIRMRATNTNYEQRDCFWTTLYTMYQHSWIKPIILKITIFIVILIIFVFFTTPVVIVSSIDTFFAIPPVTETIKKIVEVGGPMMSVIFQYIPSLLLVASSALIPVFIYQLTKLEDMKTFSEFSRTILRRITIFLWLNVFILPTLVLTTLDGITNFFTNPDSLANIFKNLFMSDNGSLFINFILNKTLYGLAFTLMPLLSLILYSVFTLCTSSVSKKLRISRNMKPKDKLKWAEGDSFSLEYSYAYSILIMAIVFTFSLFSPFILLVTFIYFTLRYYVERFTIGRIYSHRLLQHHHKKKRHLITSQGYYLSDSADQTISPAVVRHSFGCLFGFKTDYVAHRRSMLLISKLCVVALIMFTVYCMLFFAFKTPESQYFIFHVTIEAILTLFLLIVFFAIEIKMTRDIRTLNKQPLIVNEESASKKTLYEPSNYWNYKKMFNDTVTNL